MQSRKPFVVHDTPQGVVISVHVQPKASKTEYAGVHGEALKIRIAAPPHEGAANKELCRYLAEVCGVSPRAVVVQSGYQSRRKRILVEKVHSLDLWKGLQSSSQGSSGGNGK